MNFNSKNLEEIKAHFNLAFEYFGGSVVPIIESALDPGKHSAVTFKKILNLASGDFSRNKLGENSSLGSNSSPPRFKDRKGGVKDSSNSGTQLSSIALRGRGSMFKSSGNSRNPLTTSKDAMAKLIPPTGRITNMTEDT